MESLKIFNKLGTLSSAKVSQNCVSKKKEGIKIQEFLNKIALEDLEKLKTMFQKIFKFSDFEILFGFYSFLISSISSRIILFRVLEKAQLFRLQILCRWDFIFIKSGYTLRCKIFFCLIFRKDCKHYKCGQICGSSQLKMKFQRCCKIQDCQQNI